MEVIVTKQVGIEAETIESAIEAVNNGEGKTITLSGIERPPSTIGSVTGSQFQTTKTVTVPGKTTVNG